MNIYSYIEALRHKNNDNSNIFLCKFFAQIILDHKSTELCSKVLAH